MRAVKIVERKLDKSRDLLMRMASDPEKVLEALKPSEVREVMGRLHLLTKQASAARKGSDLLAMSEEVNGSNVEGPRVPVEVETQVAKSWAG